MPTALKYRTDVKKAFPMLEGIGSERMLAAIEELPRMTTERNGFYIHTSRKISKAEMQYLKGYSHGLAFANYDMED